MVFKNIGFKYEPYLCNGCHYLIQKAMNFNDVDIVSIKVSGYRTHFWHISKDDAINLMKKSNLKKSGSLQIFFVIYKK